MQRWLVVGLMVSAVNASAFGVGPQTLWQLTRDSSLIILANVKSVETNPNATDDATTHIAKLLVKETWVGLEAKTVDVLFAAETSCPAPPAFRVGTDVAVFLYRDDDGSLRVMGERRMYDSSSISPTRDLVQYAARLQTTLPENERAPLSWSVKALSNRPTLFDGANEFAPTNDRGLTAPTSEVLDALEAEFIRAPLLDDALVQAMTLLRTRHEAPLHTAFANAIETVLSRGAPAWVDRALDEFEHRGNPLVEERVPRVDDPRKRWAAMKTRFSLHPRVLDVAAESR